MDYLKIKLILFSVIDKILHLKDFSFCPTDTSSFSTLGAGVLRMEYSPTFLEINTEILWFIKTFLEIAPTGANENIDLELLPSIFIYS
jgi:hypothetical protein